jgi:RNA polymerase sigma-70 factor (ECF subfamily)
VVGGDRVATLLLRFKTVVPDAVFGPIWLNGAPACRIDLAGELDTAVSVMVADGRITRIYAIRNPHKLARLDEEATLSRCTGPGRSSARWRSSARTPRRR